MTLESDIRTLSALPVFDQLEVEAIRLVAFSAVSRNLKPGDSLFREGDTSDGGYLVLDGAIAMERGGIQREVARAGALIGEAALLAETECVATATALEATRVMFVARSLFRRVLGEFPGSAGRLRATMSKRLMATAQELDRFRQQRLED